MASSILPPMDIGYIESHINTQWAGKKIIYYNTISSTMTAALEEIASGVPHGTIVIAEVQQSGTGRMGREWFSPQGGVYLSVIIYPQDNIHNLFTITASLAACDCIQKLTKITPEIKWPNDIHINGKKVCGILALCGTVHNNIRHVIIGVGINVCGNIHRRADISQVGINLNQIAGKAIAREEVICAFLECFERRYHMLMDNHPLWKEYENRLNTIGKRISIKSGNNTFEGVAESVNPEGCLLLRQDNDKLKIIPAGDVTVI